MSKTPWLDRSEVVTGLVLRERLPANLVNPDDLHPPYNEIIQILRSKGTLEDAVAHSYSMVRDSTMAADLILQDNSADPLVWLTLLEQASARWKSGTSLKKMADKLMEGGEIDGGMLLQFASELDLGYRNLTPLSQVEPEDAQWIATGYEPIDTYVGGLPKAGLITIGASTGIGKTTLALRIGLAMVRKYKKEKKKIAIFSLEMKLSQVMARYLNLDKSITKTERAHILASESAYTLGEIYATASKAAAHENLAAIFIDFADLLVEGEQSEAVMGVIYRTLAVLAKTTGIPVVLICQLNRQAYTGGIPKIHHIRYSGMAEMMSSLILLLYNPSSTLTDVQANSILPFFPDKGYIIVGKSRFGFKRGKPGAVQVDFFGETGWGDRGYNYFDVFV